MKKVINFLFLVLFITNLSFAQEGIPKQKEMLKSGKLKIKEIKQNSVSFEMEVNGLENFSGEFSTLNKSNIALKEKELPIISPMTEDK